MEVVEQILLKLSSRSAEDTVEALHLLVTEVGATGGGVGMMQGTGCPHILFTSGEPARVTTKREIYDFFRDFWEGEREPGASREVTIEGRPRFACVALSMSKDDLFLLALWGDERARFDDYALMRVVLRLIGGALYSARDGSRSNVRTERPHRIYPPGYVAGHSQAIVLLHKECELLSRGGFPVLILGETGVGKEHVAHLLHSWSARSRGPFVAVNCAAIPGDLWEAEMFGVTKGAATGVAEREGYFEQAHGGTLFLDEVGELSLPFQAKLLRVLQDQVVPRVGGSHVAVDVRVVTATNNDLLRRVEERLFRADLYYRIASIVLRVPSLRERRGDLSLLFHHFLKTYCKEAGKSVAGITLEAFELLSSYEWPGNVRELEYEVRRLVYLCPNGEPVTPALLPERIARIALRDDTEGDNDLNLQRQLDAVERQMILRALELAEWNRTRAAKILGVTRPGLAMKMERLSIGRSGGSGEV